MSQQGTEITPVIVLGFNRTGTTWLGNTLTENFEISSVKHDLHYGVLESSFYLLKKQFGNFETIDNYLDFLNVFAESDYFVCSGVAKDEFYGAKHENYFSLFLDLMDRQAILCGTKSWTTKLDPYIFFEPKELTLFLEMMSLRYKKIKYVSIHREESGFLASHMAMKVNEAGGEFRKLLSGMYYMAQFRLIYRRIDTLQAAEHGLKISYEEMKRHPLDILKGIEQYLELPIKREFKESPSVRNTSFSKSSNKKRPPKTINSKIIFFSKFLTHAIQLITVYRNNRNAKSYLYWRLLKAKYYPEELRTELSDSGQLDLLKLFDAKWGGST